MGPYKLVIFDADKTLIKLECPWEKLEALIKQQLEEKGLEKEGIERMFSAGLTCGWAIAEALGLKKELDQIWREWEPEAVRTYGFQLYPFSRELLKNVKKREKKTAIASGNCHETLEYVFSKAGLMPYLDAIYGRDDVERTKPSPLHFKKILQDFGVAPEEAIVVGDNPLTDKTAAQLAGITAIHINEREKLLELISATQ